MSNTETMTGGEAMIRAAVANGIDTIFGLPGAQIYPMFDAIYRSPDINAIFSRHEQGAAYMAFGYWCIRSCSRTRGSECNSGVVYRGWLQ